MCETGSSPRCLGTDPPGRRTRPGTDVTGGRGMPGGAEPLPSGVTSATTTSGTTTPAPPLLESGRAPLSTPRLVAAIVALGLGGFAIGTTEFVTMGLLPDIAAG